jgi:signal transduction histidine kinase/DNA-binding response OmpR family regulator/Tfp pilus assembly protein PilF
MRRGFSIFLLFLTIAVCSQSIRIDSLTQILEKHTHDSVELSVLRQLATEFLRKDLGKAKKLANMQVILAGQLGMPNGLSSAYSLLVTIHQRSGNLDSAKFYLEKHRLLSEENPKNILWASNYATSAGLFYKNQSKFSESLPYLLEAIRLSPTGDSTALAGELLNVGNVYNKLGDLKNAANYHLKSLVLFEQVKNSRGQSFCLQGLGNDYLALRQFSEAEKYFFKAEKLKEELGDTRGILSTWISLGELYQQMDKLELSVIYSNKALVKAKEMKLVSEELNILFNIGILLNLQGKMSEAKIHLKEALTLSKHAGDRLMSSKIETQLAMIDSDQSKGGDDEKTLKENIKISEEMGDRPQRVEALFKLAEWYGSHNQFEKAFIHLKQAQLLNDSVRSVDVIVRLKNLEEEYERDKKEKEIALLKKDQELQLLAMSKQKVVMLAAISGFILVCTLAFILFRMFKIKSRSNNKLEELDHLKSRFFTNISHEFRTPLTLILTPLQQKIAITKDQKDLSLFQMMQRNASRLLELINQLLELSKLESGNLKLHAELSDIHNFINIQASSFTSLATQKNIRFEIDISSDPLRIYFDKDKLQKIVFNLLSNAFKFTPDSGEISMSVSHDSELLSIKIKNSGRGISEHDLAFIFERFYQAENGGIDKQVGSGVGLALTKEIVQLHHGDVKVKSTQDEYTEFIVSLPTKESAYSQNEKSSNQSMSEVANYVGYDNEVLNEEHEEKRDKLPILLVVEDNEDIRNYIKTAMKDSYDVVEASDGKEGLQKAIKIIPDLIISDLMMPKMTGVELCNTIKSDERTSHVPFILLTAKADSSSKIEGLKTGADDYIVKPFDVNELMVRGENLIEQRKKLRQLFGRVMTLQPADISLTSSDEIFLKKAFDFVESNISNSDLSVEELQLALGMSRSQLHRKLKALTDCSASEFVRIQRLKRAAQFLESNSMNISEAAYASGFNNLSYFTKCFKEQFEVSPSQYALNSKKRISPIL